MQLAYFFINLAAKHAAKHLKPELTKLTGTAKHEQKNTLRHKE